MARALAAAIAVSLLAVSGAGAAGAQTLRRGGTLVIGTRTASEPACLNVLIDAYGGLPLPLEQVLPGAFEVLPNATLQPDLADAEIVAKQPFTLVYHIRSEARWSDGVPVSAQDFVFTLQALRKYQPDDDESVRVRSVRRLDPKSAKVVLRSRFSTAPSFWRTARTTSGTGGAIAIGRIGRGGYSSRRAAARGQTASMSAPATNFRFASLRFATAAGVERRELTVRLAQTQLRKVGIEVIPVFAPPPVLFGQIIPSGDFDIALFSWGQGASTAGPSDIFRCQGPSNNTGYCDRLITRDLVHAAEILDDSKRVGLLNKIDARLAKAVPAIPLFQNTGLFALKSTVRDVVPNGVGSWAWNAESWWLDR